MAAGMRESKPIFSRLRMRAHTEADGSGQQLGGLSGGGIPETSRAARPSQHPFEQARQRPPLNSAGMAFDSAAGGCQCNEKAGVH